jgi:hypothetical protein
MGGVAVAAVGLTAHLDESINGLRRINRAKDFIRQRAGRPIAKVNCWSPVSCPMAATQSQGAANGSGLAGSVASLK